MTLELNEKLEEELSPEQLEKKALYNRNCKKLLNFVKMYEKLQHGKFFLKELEKNLDQIVKRFEPKLPHVPTEKKNLNVSFKATESYIKPEEEPTINHTESLMYSVMVSNMYRRINEEEKPERGIQTMLKSLMESKPIEFKTDLFNAATVY